MLSGALSPSDLYAQGFLNELRRRCLSYTHLAVMLRKSKAEPVIRSRQKSWVDFAARLNRWRDS
jgi:hypothetical protein